MLSLNFTKFQFFYPLYLVVHSLPISLRFFKGIITVIDHQTNFYKIYQGGSSGIGGGVESHPRLTSEVMYRSIDNITSMPQARLVLLNAAPSNFKISLSCCYNYTSKFTKYNFFAQF